jgi:hypothetical protein
MSNASSNQDAVSLLASQSDAIGRLAQDNGGFAAVVAAFESKDANAFRWVLDRLEMLPYCELICEWVRIKLCVLRCVEVCGPPRVDQPVPSLEEFAQAVVRLSSNAKLLRRAVDAVSCGDASAYHAVISELKLDPFCHLICQWVCSEGYRRVCEVVCRPGVVSVSDPATELEASGKVLAALIANKKAISAIGDSAVKLNCVSIQTAINEAGFISNCETICRFFCIWRRVWVCRTLCQDPPEVLTGAFAIEEAQKFALATRQLAAQPRALGDLVSAVQTIDAEAYRGIISQLRLGPYCWQVCAWVTSVTCFEFCYCVCPNQSDHPWFTNVGDFNIAPGADIDTTTGLTLHPENSHGGPNFAFFSNGSSLYPCLSLGGLCPYLEPVTSQPMAYRFLYQPAGAATPTPISPAGITGDYVYGVNGSTGVNVGYRYTTWHGIPNTLQKVWITGTGSTSPTPPVFTPSPTPPDHYIVPDDNGWVLVDPAILGGIFDGPLMGFASNVAFPGGAPTPGVPAGTAVPTANQNNGVNTSIIFQATRVSTISAVNGGAAPDYTNQLDTIRINNWDQVQELNFLEFATGCCTPIDQTLSIQITVDHEEMGAGSWNVDIHSCALASDIYPISVGPVPPAPAPVTGVTFTADGRGGSGTIVQDTSKWCNCSYTVNLNTAPGLTTGLVDRIGEDNQVTFAICKHSC